MKKISNKLILGIFVIVLILGVFPYDTDESYQAVMEKYGYDIGERTRTADCETDGVSVERVPFGTRSIHCDTSWFVLFNIFPFQGKGDLDVDEPVKEFWEQDLKEIIKFDEVDSRVVSAPIPKGWFMHRASNQHIMLTRSKELLDIEATEGYAYGEQINIDLIKIDMSPEEGVAQKTYIDLDDVLVLSKEWTISYEQKILSVESEAAGFSGKQYTRYLFVDDFVYIVSLYPLETYDTESGIYVRNHAGLDALYKVSDNLLLLYSIQKNPMKSFKELRNLTPVNELLMRFSQMDLFLNTQLRNGDIRWINEDGYSILVPGTEYFLAVNEKIGCPRSEESATHIYEKELSVAEKMFLERGYVLDKNNSSFDESDERLYDYVQTYVKGDELCAVIVNAECSSYVAGMDMAHDLRVSCGNTLKEASDEQLPFLEALEFKDTNTVVRVRKQSGDFFQLGVRGFRGGQTAIVKKEGETYRLLLMTQEAPYCNLIEEEQIPREVLSSIGGGDCWTDEEYIRVE
ncbi:hypothetical protein ACFL0K_01755 [Patescibacteria group bacterium]